MLEVEHRVVGAAVAEAQLERLEAEGPAEQLVAEADPEHRPASSIARTSSTQAGSAAGSPGPLARTIPSGDAASTSAAGASHGITVTLAPASHRRRTIEPLTP